MEPPRHKRPITCKWLLRCKYNSDGSISRYKACLVARGFSQIPGIDYTETFSPVVKITSLRILIALAAQFCLHLHQMDVQTAFLHGSLCDHELYMEQPPHYISPGQEHLVCKLVKSLYGLKQSSRVWYQRFNSFLQTLGYTRMVSDLSVYFRQSQGHILIIGLYVDDLLLASSSLTFLQTCKSELALEFSMTDHGPTHFCLGIHIQHNAQTADITISQTKYIEDMLHRFQMTDVSPVTIPMPTGSHLTSDDAPHTMDDHNFMAKFPNRQAADSIRWLVTCSRPDISYTANQISQQLQHLGYSHWLAVKRLFGYLHATCHLGICYQSSRSNLSDRFSLQGWTDADWATDVATRRSISGYVFSLAGGTISWNTKKQSIVALSTTESEYVAATSAVKEGLWITKFLIELHLIPTLPLELWCDNQSCIHISKNPALHECSKHMACAIII